MRAKLAREDFFKHYRMSASMRAAKRGDGEMFTAEREGGVLLNHLLEIDAAKRARENLFEQFWASAESRRSIAKSKLSKLSTPIPPKNTSSNYRLRVPKTLSDAYLEFGNQGASHRAVAITEAVHPFKIVDVNKSWIDLCGFTRNQAAGKPIRSLLQGPATDQTVAKTLSSLLLLGKDEYDVVLTNYKSNGKPFRNHIQVGPIRDEVTGVTTHFVGVFEEVKDSIWDS